MSLLPFVSEQPRHKHQETVLDMIAKILAEFETVLKTKVVEHELQAANSKLGSSKSTLDTAKEELRLTRATQWLVSCALVLLHQANSPTRS